MRLIFIKNTVLILLLTFFSCGSTLNEKNEGPDGAINDLIDVGSDIKEDHQRDLDREASRNETSQVVADTTKRFGRPIAGMSTTHIYTGANQFNEYLPLFKGKKVGIVANQTSIVNDTLEYPDEVRVVDAHLVDFLNEFYVDVRKVFAPEHGFRGTADAGEAVKDGIDPYSKLPVISLYGKNKKPTKEQLEGIDIMVFDIQDVGARFYTYISTLHYIMEACAENDIPLVVMDRPNPNGHYIDGPVLEKAHSSFVGMHPVPVVHGMTIGEYARMINGEGWLSNNMQCDLTVIRMKNYTKAMSYTLPVKPSPNLPNDVAITLYPSLCFFEGTIVSAGRGTDKQFQIYGAPSLPASQYKYTFKPQANEGAKHPKFKGEICHGEDLSTMGRMNSINLEWLIEAYEASTNKGDFFNSFFTNLAGNKTLQEQIEKGLTYREIRKTWSADLAQYDKMRQKYLLYKLK